MGYGWGDYQDKLKKINTHVAKAGNVAIIKIPHYSPGHVAVVTHVQG